MLNAEYGLLLHSYMNCCEPGSLEISQCWTELTRPNNTEGNNGQMTQHNGDHLFIIITAKGLVSGADDEERCTEFQFQSNKTKPVYYCVRPI